MKEIDFNNFIIVETTSGSAYEGLRDLWCRTFDDTPEYVDAFYANFGDDITGYAVVADQGDGEPDSEREVLSALTCYPCGEYKGRPVCVSYAICTREDVRGHGLAAMLTSFVRDSITAAGGISVVSPAEPSLVSYYAELGYEPHFFAIERAVMSPEYDPEDYDDFDEYDFDINSDGHFERAEGSAGDESGGGFRPAIDLKPLSREKYNIYREAFLSGRPHIMPTDAMLKLMESESLNGCSMYSINRGDAICIISYADPLRVVIEELILNPVLHELSMDIDSEIASMIAMHYDAAEAVFKTPGAGGVQGMACGLPDRNADPYGDPAGDPYADLAADPAHNEAEFTVWTEEPFYGFPIP